jgi:hypothetical protein
MQYFPNLITLQLWHRGVYKMCVASREVSFIRDAFSGFGGLGVACCLYVPKFAGSNPVEAVRIFKGGKSSGHIPSEGK